MIPEPAWDAIRRLLDDPDHILQQFEKHAASHAATRAHAQTRHAKLEGELKNAHAEETRVVPLYREGKIDDTLLEAQLQEVRGKREALKRQIEALRPTLDAPELTVDTQRAVRAFTQYLRCGLDNANFYKKQRVRRLFVDPIKINPDAASATL